MTKVRILQIVGDPVGGIRKHVHDILKGLSEEFDFFYVSSSMGDKAYYREINALSETIANHLTLKIKKRPSLTDLANVIRIYSYIRKNKIEIVHGHGAKGGLYARICGKLTGCKVIYTPHGGVVHNMFSKYEDILYKSIEQFLCRFTDLLIFESNYTAEAFDVKFGCQNTKKIVNYNGVQPPTEVFFNSELTESSETKVAPKKIGVFGLMREQKGQHLALKTAKSLINAGYKIQLHFYGDGPLRERLQCDVIESKLEQHIFFHGEVDNVHIHMDQMDFILIPSLFESYGYVAVEAMFAKKPIISSNVGGLKETIPSKFCFIFNVDVCSSIEGAVVAALTMESKRLDDNVERAYSHAMSLFQISDMILKLKNIYLGLSLDDN